MPPSPNSAGPDGDAAPAAQATPDLGTRLSSHEIHENVLRTGEEEMRRPAGELAWAALEAGLMIGFSLFASAFLASLVGPEYRTAAAAVGYPLGFIFVVMARSQLFTENTLEPVVPLLARRDAKTLRDLLRLWGIVLPGNLVGALVIALLAARTPLLAESLRPSLHAVAEHATSGGFGLVFYKAIFGGWLVALMAWLVSATAFTGAQVLFVWLTTASISALGFKHSIAGAVEAFYRAAAGAATWGEMLGGFLLPAVLGNIVGGVVLVALLNHGQVGSRQERAGAGRR